MAEWRNLLVVAVGIAVIAGAVVAARSIEQPGKPATEPTSLISLRAIEADGNATAPSTTSSTAAPAPPVGPCNSNAPLTGVPNASQFVLEKPCATLAGTVRSVWTPDGGGYQINLRPDDTAAWGRTVTLAILPPLCQSPEGPCGASVAGVRVLNFPSAGEHIEATGPLATAQDESRWMVPLTDWHALPG